MFQLAWLLPVHVIEAAQAYALFLHDKRGSCPTLHAKKFPALKMDRNGDGLGPTPLPWQLLFAILPSFQEILSCLLLHPTTWDRKKHFGDDDCGHACGCCRSRWMFLFETVEWGCSPCRTAWVLTTVCKDVMHSVRMHNATCSCLTCSKSWMDKGWVCPWNPWQSPRGGRDLLGRHFFCRWYDSPFQSIGGWSDDSDDQSLEESPHAANAHPESPDTHSPRSSVSSPWTIYPESQDGFEGEYSLDGGESEEEQHEEVPELA